VFGLSNQCSIVNRIGLSTIEKKFGTLCVRYAYIGRLCQRLTDFYKFYEKSYEPILFGVQLIKATIFVTKKFLFINQKPQGLTLARDKVILIMERVKQLPINYALATPWFYWR
jgi:hypothetical protein